MGIKENCKIHFGTSDLYEVLLVSKTASASELKKAYKKLSLTVHPDRVEEALKEEATKKFQTLAKVYFILSDSDKRAEYDETGEIDDENDVPQEKDWTMYWRLLFPKLTEKDITDYIKKYKGSKEEIDDLKECYRRFEGDMDMMSEHVLGYDVDDEERYQEIISDLIKKKELPDFKKFTKEDARKKRSRHARYANEAKEAEELRKELNMEEGDEALKNAITQRNRDRQSAFDNMISSLEKKYTMPQGNKGKKKKKL